MESDSTDFSYTTPKGDPPSQSTIRYRRMMAKKGKDAQREYHQEKNSKKSSRSSTSSTSRIPMPPALAVPMPALESDALGLKIGTHLPHNVIPQILTLQKATIHWVDAYDLTAIYGTATIDDCHVHNYLARVSSKTSAALNAGCVSQYQATLAEDRHFQAAIKMSSTLQSMFQDVISALSPFPEAMTAVLLEKAKLDTARCLVFSGAQLAHSLVESWNSQSSPALSRMLFERLDSIGKDFKHDYLSYRDLQTLRPRVYLNDNTLEYFMTSLDRGRTDILCLPSLFYSHHLRKAHNKRNSRDFWETVWKWDYGKLKTQMPQVKRIILTINQDAHWILLHINLPKQRVEVLNSWQSSFRENLGDRNWSSSAHAPHIRNVIAFINEIRREFEMNWIEDVDMFDIFPHLKVPFQSNAYDCGVYAIVFARHLHKGDTVNNEDVQVKDQITSNLMDMDPFRMSFLQEIVPI
ncbi:Ubiquitin-like-specific protease 1 [Hypsizygus marmoreus]|uniref:Ubiquitin-like-specific protease 1 n=1 Tax=Hypsizygus marmoreus TaxID=39966 RepID=A0A369JVX0_HYPMA|nr:Ubiquitin-like-specific protease 1 [Hypsizygus marmoreus]